MFIAVFLISSVLVVVAVFLLYALVYKAALWLIDAFRGR